jgi:hypothetical protein
MYVRFAKKSCIVAWLQSCMIYPATLSPATLPSATLPPATLPPCHSATLPPCHSATLQPCHPPPATLLFSQQISGSLRFFLRRVA